MEKISILGAGSWGTALATVLESKGYDVWVWGRNREHIDEINALRENKKYLPNIKLSPNIKFSYDLEETIHDSEIIVLAVSSQGTREVLIKIKPFIKDQIIVNVSKGIENGTLMRISEVVKEFLPDNKFAALSGPTHAEEVSRGIPSAIVSASTCKNTAEKIQDVFITPNLRVYTSTDLVGVELGGALKNVIALGAGISDGLGYGDNTKAAIITRGIREISRLGVAMGGHINTFAGLTGIGDLIVTCTSIHSRNRRCGILLGQGKTLEEAINAVGMVVEGVKTTKSAYELSKKYNVEMPITNEIYDILYNDKPAKESVYNLMMRDKRCEVEQW